MCEKKTFSHSRLCNSPDLRIFFSLIFKIKDDIVEGVIVDEKIRNSNHEIKYIFLLHKIHLRGIVAS